MITLEFIKDDMIKTIDRMYDEYCEEPQGTSLSNTLRNQVMILIAKYEEYFDEVVSGISWKD